MSKARIAFCRKMSRMMRTACILHMSEPRLLQPVHANRIILAAVEDENQKLLAF